MIFFLPVQQGCFGCSEGGRCVPGLFWLIGNRQFGQYFAFILIYKRKISNFELMRQASSDFSKKNYFIILPYFFYDVCSRVQVKILVTHFFQNSEIHQIIEQNLRVLPWFQLKRQHRNWISQGKIDFLLYCNKTHRSAVKLIFIVFYRKN